MDVFHASGEGAWASTSSPTATLTGTGGATPNDFGATVAISSDGTTALVTIPRQHTRRGAAFIFRVSGEGAWASSSAPTATLTDSGGRPGDMLGAWAAALSADGATALSGAPGVRSGTGAADVFRVSDASAWTSTSTPTASLTDSALACVVPKLRGLTVRAAKTRLNARSCGLGRVRRVQAKAREGHVVFQSRRPGSRWVIGTPVAIKIAK